MSLVQCPWKFFPSSFVIISLFKYAWKAENILLFLCKADFPSHDLSLIGFEVILLKPNLTLLMANLITQVTSQPLIL